MSPRNVVAAEVLDHVRKWGFISGEPPVKSTVWMEGWSATQPMTRVGDVGGHVVFGGESGGGRVDVAVVAGEVAAQADVDLEGGDDRGGAEVVVEVAVERVGVGDGEGEGGHGCKG